MTATGCNISAILTIVMINNPIVWHFAANGLYVISQRGFTMAHFVGFRIKLIMDIGKLFASAAAGSGNVVALLLSWLWQQTSDISMMRPGNNNAG